MWIAKNNRRIDGISLQNIAKARFQPPIKIISWISIGSRFDSFCREFVQYNSKICLFFIYSAKSAVAAAASALQ